MDRYVISAPRSGLNWTRFCVEYFYGLRTPGKPLLFPKVEGEATAFTRSHDPLNWTRVRTEGGPRPYIDPASTEGGVVVLILRDPLESYVRMAHRTLKEFRCYAGNIRFLTEAAATEKRVFYYNDLVADPATMAELLDFLRLEPAPGYTAPSAEELAERWQEAGDKSRDLYDQNQGHRGGAKTRKNPLDFKFHQKKLSDWHKHRAWRYLEGALRPEELHLLERYRMDVPTRPADLLARLTDWL